MRRRLGCPWNWDSILSYSTVKIIRIQDKRLGLLHYFFIACIIAYILGYNILYDLNYLKLEVPVGSIRTSLMSAQSRGTLPPPAESIPYCLQASPSLNGFPNYECLYWDENFVVFPSLEPGAMFITTRVTNQSEELENGCSLSSNLCKYVLSEPSNNIYIADIEDFTLLIDHAMFTSQVGLQANGQDLPGKLLDSRGNQIKQFPSGDVVGEIGKQDILHVSLVLQAAGVDLDTAGYANRNISKRNDGIVLLVFITYSNTYTFDTNDIRYEISIEPVTNTKFKSEQPIYTKSYEKRVIWNRHGIRLLFLTTGSLGKFDFQVLLLTFVSGLGLLAVATLVVDVIAVWIIPNSAYKKFKYKEAPRADLLKDPETTYLQSDIST